MYILSAFDTSAWFVACVHAYVCIPCIHAYVYMHTMHARTAAGMQCCVYIINTMCRQQRIGVAISYLRRLTHARGRARLSYQFAVRSLVDGRAVQCTATWHARMHAYYILLYMCMHVYSLISVPRALIAKSRSMRVVTHLSELVVLI